MKLSSAVIECVKALQGNALKKALATGLYAQAITEPLPDPALPDEPGQDDEEAIS